MTDRKQQQSRRRFLYLGASSLAAIPVLALVARTGTSGEEQTELVSETDPTALALGYVHDATRTDTEKFPKRAGADGQQQFCSNCSLYQGEESDERAPCSIFGGKQVKAKGWCNAWVPRS